MTTRMLIDARHREETRVAVIKGNRIEEFDFESAEHKQIKGNIYLAKVTRVEPSLQAAFVEYGGNRHGFLAFSEIHPDYYQIPKEDREALLHEEAELAAAEAAMRAEDEIESLEGEVADVAPSAPFDDDDDDAYTDVDGDDERARDGTDDGGNDAASDGEPPSDEDNGARNRSDHGRGNRRGRGRGNAQDRGERDEAPDFRRSLHRRYKIQDVIRRRQVLLVQVVKEERGTKGAALTSYLSLAGRYCVLMPNSSNGGGISRKIANGADRKRLKSVIDELGLPTTMGCIVRTAGLERTKAEIKRDFDYLARLWDEIRERTLGSEAPALIHSDSDLIKRAIRDIYNSEILDVSVEGDEGYRAAKDFMKLLMPSHARRVKQYTDAVPLFQRYGVEDQLAAMYQPLVTLKSGGYLVINPTEALVSIDINSGKSTREHNIELTALNTNLEAAYEIGRQLRLRDMAGLVVIDFIDMEVGSNVRKVERAMRDALKNDRARIQIGRISGFGLMEMSRQRLRTGVLEASTRICPHCEGTGLVRTASSAGLSALRLLEEEAARGRGSQLLLRTSQEAAVYVLNNKRTELSEIESRFGVTIEIQPDGHTEGARMTVEASGPAPTNLPRLAPIIYAPDDDEDDDVIDDMDMDDAEDDGAAGSDGAAGADGGESHRNGQDAEQPRRKRGRRRRRGRDGEHDERGNDRNHAAAGENQTDDREVVSPDDGSDAGSEAGGDSDNRGERHPVDADGSEGPRRRRRGRRGGRGRRSDSGSPQIADGEASSDISGEDTAISGEDTAPPLDLSSDAPPTKPKRASRARTPAKADDAAGPVAATPEAAVEPDAAAKPKRAGRSRKPVVAAAGDEGEVQAKPAASAAPAEPAKPKRVSKGKNAGTGGDAVAPANASAELVNGAGSDEAATDGGDRRRGWWNRTFGA